MFGPGVPMARASAAPFSVNPWLLAGVLYSARVSGGLIWRGANSLGGGRALRPVALANRKARKAI